MRFCGAQIPEGYVVVLEDTELMRGEAFFKPGVDKASWNDTTPSTRILVRHDHYKQVGCHLRNRLCHSWHQPLPLSSTL